MNVQVKSSNGITVVPVEASLMDERILFIEEEINQESANEFVKKFLFLNKQNSDRPIYLLINSLGGEVTAGLLIYDVIQSSKVPIITFCVGRAYSMAAVLFASGNKRYVMSHSEIMLHEPLLGNKIQGNASSIKSVSDSLMDTKRKINGILAKHTGKKEKEIEKATSYDHYFSSTEAVEFGLADEIADINMIMEE